MIYALQGAENVPREWLEGTPFDSYRWPGLYLGTAVGGTALLSTSLVWRQDPRVRLALVVSAGTSLTWVGAQVAMIGYRSPLQPLVAAGAVCVGTVAVGCD